MNIFKTWFIIVLTFLTIHPLTALAWYDIEEPPPIKEKEKKQTEKPATTTAPTAPETVGAATVYGKVISMGNPISGATVMLGNGMSAVTDAKGEYRITGIAPGEYTIMISAPGCNTANGTVTLAGGQTKSVLSSLSPDYMPARNSQLNNPEFNNNTTNSNPDPEIYNKPKTVRKSTSTKKEKAEKEYGCITVKAYPMKDLFGGFRDDGRRWWVYSIKVEQMGSGTLRWSNFFNRPVDRDDRTKELFCSGAVVGDDYRIEIEWRSVRGGDSRTRHWTKTMDRSDVTFTFDAPSY